MLIAKSIRRGVARTAVGPMGTSPVGTPLSADRPGANRRLAHGTLAGRVLVMATGLLASASLFIATPASAHNSARGLIGVHNPAIVVCHGPLPQKISMIPQIGTQPGKEWGQWVSLRYSIMNADTGAWPVNEPWSQSKWIFTKWPLVDTLGRNIGWGTQTYGSLPETSYTLPRGRYVVWVSYQWHDGQNWSGFDQSKTVSYTNMRSYHTTQASLCVID